MKIAVFSDVHGNLKARKRVLTDSDTELEGASYLLIEADENGIGYEHISI